MFDPDGQHLNDIRWRKLFLRRMEVNTVNAFKHFRSFGIEPVLIKGWAAARNYPPSRNRFYADVDLAISPEDFDKAKNIGETYKYRIDLHCSVRHLDTRPWPDIFSDTEIVELDDCEIRIPAAEDHLRILAVHWLNDGGENKEKLWDIYYAVENRPPNFDWDKCLNLVDPNRRTWVILAIGLAHKYLGLMVDDLPFAAEAKALPAWLTKEVERQWNSGTRTRSLLTTLSSPAEFAVQLRKRFPPNPIQSTIENEGDLLSKRQYHYQLASIWYRFVQLLRRV